MEGRVLAALTDHKLVSVLKLVSFPFLLSVV